MSKACLSHTTEEKVISQMIIGQSVSEPELQTFTEKRIGEMIEVLAKARAGNPLERRMTRDEAREYTVLDPDFDPKGAWFAIVDGEVAGFCSALVERTRIEAGKDDAWVDIDIVPEHERIDVAQALLNQAFGYLSSRNVGKAMTRSLASDEKRKTFLKSNSFEEEHRIYTLVRRGRDEVNVVVAPAPNRIVRWELPDCSDSRLQAITEAFNDSFKDHMNFAPELPERFQNLRDCNDDPHVLTVALDEDVITGFALSEYSEEYNRLKGANVGWVNVLGVRPQYRRTGLGRALLADSIRWILEAGASNVYLGVFAKNEKALSLYWSFGFEKERENIIFARSLKG
ncbi:MAG: GNAT family N-acetyltransferase [Methanobacteriota archaeon]|nr:MAG: GNAT family N-acetyltransferase [Euryarchaeota archaeon]